METEIESSVGELVVKGINRLNCVDKSSAKSRLEYVLKQNPDVDTDRLKVPPELQDAIYHLNRTIVLDCFKGSAIFTSVGVGLGVLACVGYLGGQAFEKMPSTTGELGALASYGLLMIATPSSLQCLYYGIKSAVEGIREKLKHDKEKFNRPLTNRERTLANYVLSPESR